jgi:hypothetical protein
MELYNNKSISIAANITKTLGCKKDAIVRLKNYVGHAHEPENTT